MSDTKRRTSTPSAGFPIGTRCRRCKGSAADWLGPDERGIKWTVRDMQPDHRGRPVCHYCRTYVEPEQD